MRKPVNSQQRGKEGARRVPLKEKEEEKTFKDQEEETPEGETRRVSLE